MSVLSTPGHSALYEGYVVHVRRGEVEHRFAQRVALGYLDLDELPAVLDRHPLWSTGRWHPVQFRRADYTGDPAVPLADAVRDQVEASTGVRPAGPVRLLAHLRTWGRCFNPLALAFCFAPDGETVVAVVATVTNTPWGERHDYVLPAGGDGRVDVTVPKELHVSPYFGMDQTYRFGISRPGERLDVTVTVRDIRGDAGDGGNAGDGANAGDGGNAGDGADAGDGGDAGDGANAGDGGHVGDPALWAGLHLRRRPLDRAAMTALLVDHPLMTWRVHAGIYLQAARLALKGAPFHPHPDKARPERVRPDRVRPESEVGAR